MALFDIALGSGKAREPAQTSASFLSPSEVKRRRDLASELLKSDFSPIASPWQGAARLANALVGTLEERSANQAEQAGQADYRRRISSALTGGEETGTTVPSLAAQPTGNVNIPAAVRTNNPGAMWPGPSASNFGATGYQNISGGNKIATFPDAESGAAAQFDLLARKYSGMPLSDAIVKWSGGNSSPAYTAFVSKNTGISPDTILTPELLASPQGVALAKSMSRWESGRDFPMSDEQWASGQSKAFGKKSPESAVSPDLVSLLAHPYATTAGSGAIEALIKQRMKGQEEEKPVLKELAVDAFGAKKPFWIKGQTITPAKIEGVESTPERAPIPVEKRNIEENKAPIIFASMLGNEDQAAPLRNIQSREVEAAVSPSSNFNPTALENPNLSKQELIIAKMIGEGKRKFLPEGGREGAKNKYINAVGAEYNPDLDQTTFIRRQKAENYFSGGGPGGEKIISLNRFAAHSASLLNLAEQLDQGGFRTWNQFQNWLAKEGIGPKEKRDILGAWDVNAKGVGDEAAKVFAGHDPALADRQVWEKILTADTPLSTIVSKIRQASEMSKQALDATMHAYSQGTRGDANMAEFITPRNAMIFDRISRGEPMRPLFDTEGKKSEERSPAAAAPAPSDNKTKSGIPWSVE